MPDVGAGMGYQEEGGEMTDIAVIADSVDRLSYRGALGVSPSYPLGNMSLCMLDDGRFLVSVRQFNYRITPKFKYVRRGGFNLGRDYHFLIADERLGFVRKLYRQIPNVSKVEDIRLMRFEDGIQMSGTDDTHGWKHIRPIAMKAALDVRRNVAVGSPPVIFPYLKEKNYVPVEGRPGFFISDMLDGRMLVVDALNPKEKSERPCRGLIPMRGSTPLYKHGGRLVGITHHRDKYTFTNRLVSFSEDLLECQVSDPFTAFANISPINFTCGMYVSPEGECMVPFTINDCQTFLVRFNWDRMAKTLNMKERHDEREGQGQDQEEAPQERHTGPAQGSDHCE